MNPPRSVSESSVSVRSRAFPEPESAAPVCLVSSAHNGADDEGIMPALWFIMPRHTTTMNIPHLHEHQSSNRLRPQLWTKRESRFPSSVSSGTSRPVALGRTFRHADPSLFDEIEVPDMGTTKKVGE